MGLDCYLYSVPKYEENPSVVDCSDKHKLPPFMCLDEDGFYYMPFNDEILYWRKNWVVERFFERLYFYKAQRDKIDVDDNFNCCYVKVEPEDIQALIEEIKELPLEDWQEETLEDDKSQTLEKLTKLLKAIKSTSLYKGADFYFTPWW